MIIISGPSYDIETRAAISEELYIDKLPPPALSLFCNLLVLRQFLEKSFGPRGMRHQCAFEALLIDVSGGCRGHWEALS